MLTKIAFGRAWEQLSRSGSLAGIWNVTTGHGRACVAGHSFSHLHNSAAANSEFSVYVFRLPKLSPAMQSARCVMSWMLYLLAVANGRAAIYSHCQLTGADSTKTATFKTLQ